MHLGSKSCNFRCERGESIFGELHRVIVGYCGVGPESPNKKTHLLASIKSIYGIHECVAPRVTLPSSLVEMDSRSKCLLKRVKQEGSSIVLVKKVENVFYSPCGLLGGTATLAERTIPPVEASKALKASSSRLQ